LSELSITAPKVDFKITLPERVQLLSDVTSEITIFTKRFFIRIHI